MANDALLRRPGSWPRFGSDTDLGGHAHNPFFVRDGRGRYVDLAPELGMDEPQVTRGIALADVDGDGRMDFALANQWGPSRWYHNRAAQAGAFLGLRLLLPTEPATDDAPAATPPARATRVVPAPAPEQGGRAAIGAVATVHLPDGRTLVSRVDGGTGHSGARSTELHFGLGSPGSTVSATPLRVDLAWRDGYGIVRRDTIMLPPGWHTVWLGAGSQPQSE
jgi:hypothetical protein